MRAYCACENFGRGQNWTIDASELSFIGGRTLDTPALYVICHVTSGSFALELSVNISHKHLIKRKCVGPGMGGLKFKSRAGHSGHTEL